jgi:hypothetical protein
MNKQKLEYFFNLRARRVSFNDIAKLLDMDPIVLRQELKGIGVPPKQPKFLSVFNGYIYIRGKKRARLVMERILNSPIPKGFCVHHKNKNKTDDRPENLLLLFMPEHSRLHATEV